MIVFNLICTNDHGFEGWFSSSADFEKQQQSALLNCPVCGSSSVSKALHAPYVNTGNSRPVTVPDAKDTQDKEHYAAHVAREMTKVVEHLIANTEDVGAAFPEEARKIHYDEAPERKIRGIASRDEVKELREEGIDVVSIPVPKYRLGKSH